MFTASLLLMVVGGTLAYAGGRAGAKTASGKPLWQEPWSVIVHAAKNPQPQRTGNTTVHIPFLGNIPVKSGG